MNIYTLETLRPPNSRKHRRIHSQNFIIWKYFGMLISGSKDLWIVIRLYSIFPENFQPRYTQIVDLSMTKLVHLVCIRILPTSMWGIELGFFCRSWLGALDKLRQYWPWLKGDHGSCVPLCSSKVTSLVPKWINPGCNIKWFSPFKENCSCYVELLET